MFNSTQRSPANISQMLAHEARLNRLHRLFKTHFNVTEPSLVLEPYLFLGNCISAQDVNRLSKLGIRYILNVAIRDVEVCPYYPKDVRTLTIDLRDDDRENILRTFDQAFAFIDEAKRAKSRVLVHCSHGQSRSPAIVIGYLMRTYNVSLEQCLIHVVKARPCVVPNDGFLKQLILYDRFLVERRRRQHEAAMMQTVNSVPPTEIPIQHHPSVPPQSVQPSAPVISVPPHCSVIPVSDTANISLVDSSTMGLKSTSSIQSSKSGNSIHVIPIQVPSKLPNSVKIEPVLIKRKPNEDASAVEEINKNVNQLKEKVAPTNLSVGSTKVQLGISASQHALPTKQQPITDMTKNIKQLPPQMPRSKTGNLSRPHAIHHNHPSLIHSNQHRNIINHYPTNYYSSNQNIRSNYITEVYDKATNRYIPTTCY